MSENKSINKKSEKEGGKIVNIVCILIAIVAVCVVCVVLLKPDEEETPKRDVVVTADNADKVAEELYQERQEKQKQQSSDRPTSYTVTMNGEWFFTDGETASRNAYVENSMMNNNDVYFDVMISDNEEIIYESPVLPVGSHIEELTLSKDLDAGTYDCICKYYVVDEEQNTLGTVSMAVTVIVEN